MTLNSHHERQLSPNPIGVATDLEREDGDLPSHEDGHHDRGSEPTVPGFRDEDIVAELPLDRQIAVRELATEDPNNFISIEEFHIHVSR